MHQLREREREVTVRIGDKHYKMVSDDEYLSDDENGFDPHMVHLFGSLLRAGDVVLDIGANVGCTALLFAEAAKLVHAFEPSPSTFAFLSRNVKRSGLANIVVHNIGLGERDELNTISYSPQNRSGGYVSNSISTSSNHVTEAIQINRLDDLAASLCETVDFIKIDVEGFEGHVLRGSRQVLSQNRPLAVMELNHWCLNAFHRTSIPDFFDQLLEIFPILLAVDGGTYLDLGNKDDRYIAMYNHILHGRFQNVIGAFDEARLARFRSAFKSESC